MSAGPLEGDLLPGWKRGGREPVADRFLALSAAGMLLDPGLGGGLRDLGGNALELYGGKDSCGTGLCRAVSSSSSFFLCGGQLCFPGLCFLRGGGLPLSYLSLDGTGGFGIIANCSPRDLSCETRGFSGMTGFFPDPGPSLSYGGARRSREGLVLLSIEGAGGFKGFMFLSLLKSLLLGGGGKAGRVALLPPNGPGLWGGTGG